MGRDESLRRLGELIEAAEPWITIVGLPGVGKTRIARELCERRGEPSVFCDLSSARSVQALEAVVGAALDAPAGEVAESLAARGRVVIVLDNFEQLPDACARAVAAWSEAAPRVSFVVTSRRELRVSRERIVKLSPLEEADGVTLFVRTAEARGWEGAAGDGDEVRAIVRRLEGLPLAIVLAASRVRALGAAGVRAALERSIDALGESAVDAPPHHATIRKAIEASLSLTGEKDRRVLARASCFAGAFAREDLASVAGVEGAAIDAAIERLVAASLLSVQEDSAGAGYRVHAVVREIAAEALTPASRAETLDRHARRMAELSRTLSTDMSIGALARIARAGADLRSAFDRLAADATGADQACAIACALARLVDRHGATDDLVSRLERAGDIAEGGAADPVLRGRVALARANARFELGALADAATELHRALSLAREANDHRTEALALAQLATVALRGAEPTAAGRGVPSLLDDAEALARAAEDGWAEGVVVGVRGLWAFHEDDREGARAAFGRARALHRRAGDALLEGVALGILGNFAQDEGALDEAETLFGEAIGAFVALGARSSEGIFRGYRATVRDERGDLDASREDYREATRILTECRHRRMEARFRAAHAALLARIGGHEGARREIESAEASCTADDHAELAASVALHRHRVAIAGRSADDGVRHGWLARAGAAIDALDPAVVRASDDVRFARRMLERELDAALRAIPERPDAWRVALGGARICRGERVVDLATRKPLRRIVWALALARWIDPGGGVSAWTLIEAGWPGDRALPDAAAHRLRVAISTLRKLGLREVLETVGDAYRLDPRAAIEPAPGGFDPV